MAFESYAYFDPWKAAKRKALEKKYKAMGLSYNKTLTLLARVR